MRGEAKNEALRSVDRDETVSYRRGPDGEILEEEKDDGGPRDRQEGVERWRLVMETRFVDGANVDFDYGAVDEDEAYDDRAVEEQETLERYLDQEEPEFVLRTESRELKGETGLQDF